MAEGDQLCKALTHIRGVSQAMLPRTCSKVEYLGSLDLNVSDWIQSTRIHNNGMPRFEVNLPVRVDQSYYPVSFRQCVGRR